MILKCQRILKRLVRSDYKPKEYSLVSHVGKSRGKHPKDFITMRHEPNPYKELALPLT